MGLITQTKNKTYVECPFCGAYIELRLLNPICNCGSKFYLFSGYWLDRKTGQKINVSFKDKLAIEKFIENY